MKRLFFKIMFLLVLVFLPASVLAMGQVDVSLRVPLPPPIMFSAPPAMVVIPETDVYVVPDVQADIFFYGGWWWRPWEGRWYRSHNYDSGWGYYEGAPSFYTNVPPGWRNDYRQRRWKGHQWDQRRIPHQDVERNWNGWGKDRHWEKQNYWGVRDLDSRQMQQRKDQQRYDRQIQQKRIQDQKKRDEQLKKQQKQQKKKDQKYRDELKKRQDRERHERWDRDRRR